jgi:hypothetical protein
VNNSDDEREKEQKDKEKQARMEASLREREKEVQRTLATHLRDRDKEREQHKHDEAVQHFNALLADLVSGTTFTDIIQQACLMCRFAHCSSADSWKNFFMTTCTAWWRGKPKTSSRKTRTLTAFPASAHSYIHPSIVP